LIIPGYQAAPGAFGRPPPHPPMNLIPPSSDTVTDPAPLAMEKAPPKRILIIEDDESVSEVLAIRLQRQGFETLTAGSGRAGLAAAQTELPSLVILDLHLPDTDGFTICQQMVDAPQTCEIPVIILSGLERADIVRRCRAVGARYFVRKPYDPNALLALIREALREASAWDG